MYASNATDEIAQIPNKEVIMMAVFFFIVSSMRIIVRDFTNGYPIPHDFQICKAVQTQIPNTLSMSQKMPVGSTIKYRFIRLIIIPCRLGSSLASQWQEVVALEI
jgi:hypothetical protein